MRGCGPPAALPGTWSKGIAGGQTLKTTIPQNISHPLPGVLGSIVDLNLRSKKQTVRVGGKKRGHLESVGSKSSRKYEQTLVGDPSGQSYSDELTVGTC